MPGMPTPDFKDRLKAITWRNRKKTHKPGETWPIEKKVEVVGHWLVVGNMKQVAGITGVPYDLIRKWKAQPWWQEIEAEIRLSQNIELDNKLTRIVNESLGQVEDRLANGDFIYDQKSGEMKRKPVALRDIHRVAVDMMTKRQMVRKEESIDTTSKLTVEEQLKQLAMEMAKWNKAHDSKPEVIDLVEVEDAVYEERETGLQAGASVGTQEETGEGEGPSGSERSPEDDDGQGRGP